MKSFEFDIAPIEIPVKIAGKAYILREANEDSAAKFRNRQFETSGMKADGTFSAVKGAADLAAYFVSLCLFEIRENGEAPKPVPETFVRSLPTKVVQKLFEEALDISELRNKPTVEDLTKQKEEIEKKLKDLQEGKEDAVGNG